VKIVFPQLGNITFDLGQHFPTLGNQLSLTTSAPVTICTIFSQWRSQEFETGGA